MIFLGYIYIHMENILYKYGWNPRSDNKFMNLLVRVCQHKRRMTLFLMKLITVVQKVVYI